MISLKTISCTTVTLHTTGHNQSNQRSSLISSYDTKGFLSQTGYLELHMIGSAFGITTGVGAGWGVGVAHTAVLALPVLGHLKEIILERTRLHYPLRVQTCSLLIFSQHPMWMAHTHEENFINLLW